MGDILNRTFWNELSRELPRHWDSLVEFMIIARQEFVSMFINKFILIIGEKGMIYGSIPKEDVRVVNGVRDRIRSIMIDFGVRYCQQRLSAFSERYRREMRDEMNRQARALLLPIRRQSAQSRAILREYQGSVQATDQSVEELFREFYIFTIEGIVRDLPESVI